MHINNLQLLWPWLNPGEFKQTLSIHELYPLFPILATCICWERTLTKLSMKNVLAPERIRRLERPNSLAFVEAM